MRRLRRDVEHHRLRPEPPARERRQHSKRHRRGVVPHELGLDAELKLHLLLNGSDPQLERSLGSKARSVSAM